MITLLLVVFILGYLSIAFEHSLKIDKAASALLAGVGCWAVLGIGGYHITEALAEHTAAIAAIVFFIMGAMTIVEVIDHKGGFAALRGLVGVRSPRGLVLPVSLITFFLSAVLDNLTTAIVMTSVVVKLVPDKNARMLLAGLVVIAANAGGAFSPIGDVTTTMLWIGGQVTTLPLMAHLFLPSVASLIIPALMIRLSLSSTIDNSSTIVYEKTESSNFGILAFGIGLLVAVPFVKAILHVPPYIAMLGALGILWVTTEVRFVYHKKTGSRPVAHALSRIDLSSALFFLGILLAVAALAEGGVLQTVSSFLSHSISDDRIIAIVIGFASAVIDNVPLVAASMGMYDLATFPQDHRFWLFLTFCAGTGGSMLVIGSAAGVAAMGIAGLKFGWYLRRIGIPALCGYVGGIAVLFLQGIIIPTM